MVAWKYGIFYFFYFIFFNKFIWINVYTNMQRSEYLHSKTQTF